VARWRGLDGCTEVADTTAPARDLDAVVPGAETTITTYADGCDEGVRVELWRMEGSRHVPIPTDAFSSGVIDFFYSVARS
jgi:hypothetical protein